MAPVPVSSSSSVSPLLRHHPLQRVVVQPHAAARAPVDQAGGGAAHRAGVGDGLRRRKDSVQGRTTAWERRRQEVKKGKLFYQICIMGTYVGIHEGPERVSWLTIFHLGQTVGPCDSRLETRFRKFLQIFGDNMNILPNFLHVFQVLFDPLYGPRVT